MSEGPGKQRAEAHIEAPTERGSIALTFFALMKRLGTRPETGEFSREDGEQIEEVEWKPEK